MAEDLASIGADGLNGDTMQAIPREYRTASDKTGHPLAFEPEFLGVDEALAYNNLNWGQATLPGVSSSPSSRMEVQLVAKYKWLEPRHMTNISDRWQRDKNTDLQYAFFNGIGMETWENIWGIWNEMTPRDAEVVRRISKIERAFAHALISPEWEPHTPTLQIGIYASKWPDGADTLWTIVNKNEYEVTGQQVALPYRAGRKYFDLWHGSELKPAVDGSQVTLSFAIEPNGYAALLATDNPNVSADRKSLMATMKQLSSVRLESLSLQNNVPQQLIVPMEPTGKLASVPPGMIRIPGGTFQFEVSGIEIEGENQAGVDVQYP